MRESGGWTPLPLGLGSSVLPGTQGPEGQQEGLKGGGGGGKRPLLGSQRGVGSSSESELLSLQEPLDCSSRQGVGSRGAVTIPLSPVLLTPWVGQVWVREELVGSGYLSCPYAAGTRPWGQVTVGEHLRSC